MIHVDDSSIIDLRSTCTLLKGETEYRFRALYSTNIEIKMSKKSLEVIAIRSKCTLSKVETEDRLRALYLTDHKQHSILATCREMCHDALSLFLAKTILRFDNEVALKGFVSPPWNLNLPRSQYSPEKTQHCTKPMESSGKGPENCSTSHDGDVYHRVPHQRSFRVRAEQRSRFDLIFLLALNCIDSVVGAGGRRTRGSSRGGSRRQRRSRKNRQLIVPVDHESMSG